MSPRLSVEVEFRVDTQLESRDAWDEGEERTQEEMEIVALEDIIALGTDCGGLFKNGIAPTFEGSPAWVSEMIRRQKESLKDMERQKKEWLQLRREAQRELKRRVLKSYQD